MIIDSHVHLRHGNAARTEYTAHQIVESMDDAGVEKSVVFAICTTTFDAVLRAQAAHELYPDRLIPYAYALPNTERSIVGCIEEAVTGLGFKGIKIHAGECTLAEYVSDPILVLAGKLGVPCLIDFIGRGDDLERMARAFPGTSIIVAHMGRYLCTDQSLIDRFVRIAEEYENVYMDISGVILIWKIREAVERLGPERIIWGTDGPYPTPDLATYVRTDLEKVRASGISEAEQSAILAGNIARLLNL